MYAWLHSNINIFKFQGLQPAIILLHILRMQALKGEKAEVWIGAQQLTTSEAAVQFH